jgi:hypothetical protein
MTQMGKVLMIAGAGLAAAGLVIWLLGRLGFRGLPGDLRYEGGNVKVYFPVITCILLSLVLTGLLWLANLFRDWWQR